MPVLRSSSSVAVTYALSLTRTTPEPVRLEALRAVQDLADGAVGDEMESLTQAFAHLHRIFAERVAHADALRDARNRTAHQALLRQPCLPLVNGTLTLTTRVLYAGMMEGIEAWVEAPQGDSQGRMLLEVLDWVGGVLDRTYGLEGRPEVCPCTPEAPMYRDARVPTVTPAVSAWVSPIPL